MTHESRQIYRVYSPDGVVVTKDEVDRQLQYISDRLDQLESLRGDAHIFGDLEVDGDFVCHGDATHEGDSTLAATTITTTIINNLTATTAVVEETVIVQETISTVDQLITGELFAEALQVDSDYNFPTDADPSDQTATLSSALVVNSHLNVGGDAVIAGDLTVSGDVSLSGNLNATTGTVHGAFTMVDETGTQLHGWTAP